MLPRGVFSFENFLSSLRIRRFSFFKKAISSACTATSFLNSALNFASFSTRFTSASYCGLGESILQKRHKLVFPIFAQFGYIPLKTGEKRQKRDKFKLLPSTVRFLSLAIIGTLKCRANLDCGAAGFSLGINAASPMESLSKADFNLRTCVLYHSGFVGFLIIA